MGDTSYELRFNDEQPTQTFQLESDQEIEFIELRIRSSWFHPENIACLYKIQLYWKAQNNKKVTSFI